METLIYFGKVNLYWILLYACYWLVLRNHTFFRWNRFFLLGSLVAAFGLPFVIYPETAPAMPGLYVLNATSFTLVYHQEETFSLLTWENAAIAAYLLGLLVALSKLAKHILQLRNYLGSGEKIELEDCSIVLTDSNQVGSFSFLKNIVINRNDYEHHFDAILRHEMVHTQQWHSVDIIFIEILKTLFWFNPVLLVYKSSMQEVHEFLADRQATNREHYARFLVAYALNAPVTTLTNHFFKPSQIKTRIKMIYKNRSSRWMLGTYFLAVLFIGAIALVVAGCEQQETEQVQSNAAPERSMAATKDPEKVFTVVEDQPEFPGGTEAMYRFLGDNLQYPKAAIDNKIEGRVFLSFIVSETGETKDIQILKGLGYGCDAEAVRVLSKFPKWEPGKQSGKPVNVRYNLPINFQMLDKKGKKATSALSMDTKPDVNVKAAGSPLYIVDGVMLENAGDAPLKNISTDDISSVNVLKGEKATEAYGDKGVNGVVIVTTKK